MAEEGRFTLNLEHVEDYEIEVNFDWDVPDLVMDEPPPLGQRKGPNASRMLATAVANCLSASFLHCVARGDIPAKGLKTKVTCKMVRNDRKRLRVGGIDVQITASGDLEKLERLERCLGLFEDFSVVAASVREGIPIEVEVTNEAGETVVKQ